MTRAFACFVLGVLSLAIGLEIFFRIVPVSTTTDVGYHTDPFIVTYRPRLEFRIATGWDLRNAHSYRSNNYGYLTRRDFVPDSTAVALVGDSYVEASMLPEEERLGPQLEGVLRGRPVYALGGPGSNLLDYAERIRFAAETFQIRDFVVLVEVGDVRQALCGSGNIHARCLDPQTLEPRIEKQSPPSGLKRIIRHSALAQYVFSQLRFDPRAVVDQAKTMFTTTLPAAAAPMRPDDVPTATVDTILENFFSRVKPYVRGRLILVFDANRDLQSDGKSVSDTVRRRFISSAPAYGAVVVDMEPVFRRYLHDTRLSLSVSPTDGHWNREASRLAAKEIAAVLDKRN